MRRLCKQLPKDNLVTTNLDKRSWKTDALTTEADKGEHKEVSLTFWQEIVGKCIDKQENDESISITLRVNDETLKLIVPVLKPNNLSPKIIGKHVGILRTDNPLNPVVFRIIQENQKASARNDLF